MLDVIAAILLIIVAPLFIVGAVVGTGRYPPKDDE